MWSLSFRKFEFNVTRRVKVLDSLGFIVHPENSDYARTKCLIYLGFVINSENIIVLWEEAKY